MKFKYIFLSLFFGILFLSLGMYIITFAFAGLFLLILSFILIVFQVDKALSK